jgi:hypothetical protein
VIVQVGQDVVCNVLLVAYRTCAINFHGRYRFPAITPASRVKPNRRSTHPSTLRLCTIVLIDRRLNSATLNGFIAVVAPFASRHTSRFKLATIDRNCIRVV